MSNIVTYYKENDNFYLNVQFQHTPPIYDNVNATPTITINEQAEQLKYNVNKSMPILDRCSDYYCSVIRFDIPMNYVPLYIMPIIPNQIDSDKTPFILGIRYAGVNYSFNLEYLPSNNLPIPSQNQPYQVVTPYYYVYSYDVLIKMLNGTLIVLLDTIIDPVENESLRQLLINNNINRPYFDYDPTTQLISLYVPRQFITTTAPFSDRPEIFINELLQNYIFSFDFSFVGHNQPAGRDYTFNFDDPRDINAYIPYGFQVPVVGPGEELPLPQYYQFSQEYPTVGRWTSLRKIILATSSIPINKEYITPANNSDVNASFPILADFVPNIERGGETRSVAYYVPSAQYKLIDLVSDQPLYKIDINIYWEDTRGNLYPIEITSLQQASVKLGFFRKTLYKEANIIHNRT